MRAYKISYFKRGKGEVEYTEWFINKNLAKSIGLSRLGVEQFDLDKSVKQQMKDLGIKEFKVELVKDTSNLVIGF